MTLALHQIANDSAKPRDAAPAPQGLASALNELGYALARPVRYWWRYDRIMSELVYLDDDVLEDIGFSRREIASYARSRALLRWPVRQPIWKASAGIALALWRAFMRARQRRATVRELMLLDDKMLKDIGLHRSQISWIAAEMARQEAEPRAVTRRSAASGPTAPSPNGTDIGNQSPSVLALNGMTAAKGIGIPANDTRAREAS